MLTSIIERKIGCDKNTPHCNNCIRTNRICAGYGIRLIWPDQSCTRRTDLTLCHRAEPTHITRNSHQRFLNFTGRDFCLAKKPLSWRHFADRVSPGPNLPLASHPAIIGEDAMYFSYCSYQFSNYDCSPTHMLQMTR